MQKIPVGIPKEFWGEGLSRRIDSVGVDGQMTQFKSRKLIVLETNIDDMSPEWAGYMMERLFEEGALDVSFLPAFMKKSRPAFVLQVLAGKKIRDRLLRLIFMESTSLGVRVHEVERFELVRKIQSVRTPYGPVDVKIGCDRAGHVLNAAPEYESCKLLAKKKRVPLKSVYQSALKALKS